MLVADKARGASGVALAALVQAMLAQGQHAVLRLVRTQREVGGEGAGAGMGGVAGGRQSRAAAPLHWCMAAEARPTADLWLNFSSCSHSRPAPPRPAPPRRQPQRPQLLLGVPVAASGAAPAHLLLNVLPFMEDVRDYKFSSFTKKAW